MSIAVDRSNGYMESKGGECVSVFGKFPAGEDFCASSSSSSIGKNSDEEEEGGESKENEAQSKFNGGTFDSLQALEEVLPVRRGISSFYSGKSKSFASLSYVTSAKEIGKPENAYSRKRRNLMASASHVWDRSHRSMALLRGGIQKKSMHTSRSTLALAVAMSRSSSSSDGNGSSEESTPRGFGSYSRLPPLYPD
uniref:Uncharacterized protein n=1 Tax=Kalanchoe fedtschenkoi TaxID=63787 RepID=A0A7N0VE11_KALFE